MTRALVFAFMLAATLAACKGANGPANTLATVEQVVLADLAAGKTLSEVEADVARALGGETAADVVSVVQDAIAILVDTGVLPASVRPLAMQYYVAESRKLAARDTFAP